MDHVPLHRFCQDLFP
uniref:Uncharacterized protein n=1 Tax=Setaria italica TaxID=4555 RepID=A0A0Q3RCP9_SETIT